MVLLLVLHPQVLVIDARLQLAARATSLHASLAVAPITVLRPLPSDCLLREGT